MLDSWMGKNVTLLNFRNGFWRQQIVQSALLLFTALPAPLRSYEFSSYLENIVMCPEPLVIAGDFNFHMDLVHSKDAVTFNELLETFGLSQQDRKSVV